MKHLRKSAGTLILPRTILVDLVRDAVMFAPNETGGILMGSSERLSRVEVRTMVGSGPEAIHERTTFEPDQRWQESEIERLWRRDPTLEYLGDWHSHPGGGASPSRRDRAVLDLIASSPAARCPRPIMLIIAVAANRLELAALSRQGRRQRRLRIALM